LAKSKKFDKTIVYYVLGGAALGSIAGYIVKKVGVKNIVNVLKAKKIIPENILNTISEFTNARAKDKLDYLEEDMEEENRY
jgi:hypothetical protein